MKTNFYKTDGCTIPAKESPRDGERFPILKLRFAGMMASSLLSKSGIQKQKALPLGRATLLLRAGMRQLAKIIAKWRAAVSFKVAVGYQDETGFHYGVQPVPRVKGTCRAAIISAVFSGIIASIPLPASAVQNVTLTWNPSTSPDVVGYDICYGPACGTCTNKISVGNVTSATVSGLQEGACVYFVVTTRASSGLESLPSNEVSYNIPDLAILAIQTIQLHGSPTSVTITATGAIPSEWALESSPNLTTWTTVTEGTNSQVNVSLVVTGTPALFFRLRNE
ncbi:MAG: hypothetical protein ACLPYZ_17320 [Limisphaerales bacterium]